VSEFRHTHKFVAAFLNASMNFLSSSESLGVPLIVATDEDVAKCQQATDHKCTSLHHEPGACHGFDMHKGSDWVFAHGDFSIKDCAASLSEIESRKRKNDILILAVSAGVMCLVMVLELTTGTMLDSLALMSDGVHYASDVALYAWLLLSVILSGRKEDTATYSFGYHRAQVLGSLIALLLQYFATSLLLVSGFDRLFFSPRPVYGPAVCAVGLISLLANLALLRLSPAASTGHGHSHGGSVGTSGDAANVARIHMLGDLVQGSCVILTGLIEWVSPGSTWADPSTTFVYAIVVVVSSWHIFKDLLATLMERSPEEVDATALFEDLAKLKHVIGVHCCHVWALAPGKVAMSVHLHIEDETHEEVLHAAQIVVKHKYGIAHSTLQISEDEDLA